MENITGPEFGGIVAGGEAAGGNYIWLTLRLGSEDQTIIVEKSRVGALMSGIATAAALARNTRIRLNPDELNDTGIDTAYALDLADASIGRSTTDQTAILDLKVETKAGLMNVFLAADQPALARLGEACRRAALMLARGRRKVSTN